MASRSGTPAEVILHQADGEQRGVALIHVADLRTATQRVQQVDAGETEHSLLAEPVIGVATVQVIGQLAIPGIVAFDVGVQQKDREDMAGDADHVKAPGADG